MQLLNLIKLNLQSRMDLWIPRSLEIHTTEYLLDKSTKALRWFNSQWWDRGILKNSLIGISSKRLLLICNFHLPHRKYKKTLTLWAPVFKILTSSRESITVKVYKKEKRKVWKRKLQGKLNTKVTKRFYNKNTRQRLTLLKSWNYPKQPSKTFLFSMFARIKLLKEIMGRFAKRLSLMTWMNI